MKAIRKKSLVICATQLAGGALLKKLKYFKVMLNIFEFSRVWENVEAWLFYRNHFMNRPIIFRDWDDKTPASFSYFLDLSWKIRFSLQSVTILTVLISLYCNETSQLNCFVYIALAKNRWEINLEEFKSDQKYFAK